MSADGHDVSADLARLTKEATAIREAMAGVPPPRPATSPRPRPEGGLVDPSTSPLAVPLKGHRGEVEVTSPRHLAPEAHSWQPIDLVAAAQNPTLPPDLVGLFYVGKNHSVSGESEALKTWLMLAAAEAEITAGRGVLWVDGDDVGGGDIRERLLLLGASEADVSARFAYIAPDEPLEAALMGDVLEVVRARSCRLAVLDGFNPLLELHGLDPNSGVEVERFYRLIDPIRKAGTAMVLTDNVVKARGARGAWAIGSERKKSKADVHLGMKTLAPLVRGGTGRAKIDVHKDRPGHLLRPVCGIFVVESEVDGCSWRIEPDDRPDEQGEFRPTNLMEKVSRWLEVQPKPPSRNQIESAKLGKTPYVRIALDCLIEEGYASEFTGARKARLVRLERAFRESEEDDQ
jgi:hypothetical protein